MRKFLHSGAFPFKLILKNEIFKKICNIIDRPSGAGMRETVDHEYPCEELFPIGQKPFITLAFSTFLIAIS